MKFVTDPDRPAPPVERWLLLIHQLPAKPAYPRVKVWRRLQGLGAVAVKAAVYALPASPEAQEDFEWLLREIVQGGGEAMVCEARPERRAEAKAQLARLKARLAQVASIDFFGANGREAAEGLLLELEGRLREKAAAETPAEPAAAERGFGELTGRTWVTRAGVHVDRIASAWLIRRFVDPEARFKFVPAKGYAPE